MAKRGDNIRKRKDGRWEGRYKKGRTADGSIIYGSVYGKTYKEVKEKMASIISHPLQLATPKGQGKTFGEVLNLWLDNNRARLKGGTINKYQNLIDTHIMPELGLTKVNELSATRINTFLNNKISRGRVDGSGGLSASYVRSIMLVINAAIKYAVSEQLCSPLKTPICKPSADKTELPILSSEEQKKLEASLLNNFDLTGAGIYISLHTGLRIGEVCSLAWNDIDMNKRVIHVRHTVARIRSGNSGGSTILIIDTPKTKASKRDIPISSTLLPILLKLKTLSRTIKQRSKAIRTIILKYALRPANCTGTTIKAKTPRLPQMNSPGQYTLLNGSAMFPRDIRITEWHPHMQISAHFIVI